MAMKASATFLSAFSVLLDEVARAWRRIAGYYRRDAAARRLAYGLILLNVSLIVVPAALIAAPMVGFPAPSHIDFLHPGRDGSLPEMLNYAQSALTAMFLFLAWRRRGGVACLAWAAVFAFVMLDDSLRYHEVMGEWLAGRFDLGWSETFRAVDRGEVLAWALAGAVLLPPVAVAALRARGEERGFALLIAVTFAMLVLCGMLIDLLHQATGLRALAVFEDGGEMLAIAASCILSLAWYRTSDAA